MALSKHLDLRGGRPCWLPDSTRSIISGPPPTGIVDVAIVGAGVMGALLAERLTRDGHSVALLDRRSPGHGSTAASTALVMWAADTPLSHLAETHGLSEAARRWRRVHRAVVQLASRIATLDISCGWRARPELYLAGDLLDADALAAEAQLRSTSGLPSGWLGADEINDRFGITPRSAIVSGDAYKVDPVTLTLAMLSLAQARGASVTFPAEVIDVASEKSGVSLALDDGGSVRARQAVLASGYEISQRFLPKAFTLSSSFAIATAPGVAPLWEGDALIWEASDPYLYARATTDGRVIIGGGDEDFSDAKRRDQLIAAKARFLEAGGVAMIGVEALKADCAWAATFGGSPDGLPAIGLAQGYENLWLASGFGGNGVTFASLASEMIAEALAGSPDPDMVCFSPYRFD